MPTKLIRMGVDYGGHHDRSASASEASINSVQSQRGSTAHGISLDVGEGPSGRIVSEPEGIHYWRKCIINDVAVSTSIGRSFCA